MATGQSLQPVLEKKLGPSLGQHGADVDYVCPFCAKMGQDHKLHVNYFKNEIGVAICHGCEYKTGDLRFLVRDLYGSLPRDIQRMIARAEYVGTVEEVLAKKDAKDAAATLPEIPLPRSFTRIPYRGEGIARRIRRYLEGRGFTYKDIDKYALGYVRDPRERPYGYVIFPYYMHGRCVYWQGRKVSPSKEQWPKDYWKDGPPKNYNPKSTDKSRILYGYDQSIGAKTAMLVEGPLDAIAWGEGGIALTSKNLRDEQVREIALMDFSEIIVCLDGPKADGSDDTWDDLIPVNPKKKDSRKLPRPLVYALRLRSATGARVGTLRLLRDDPAEYGHEKLRRKAEKHTKWMDRDLLSQMTSLLSKV